jgi:protein involved in temperature-dependent protein secretion
MLKCIPVLKDFHTIQDGEVRELIVTTAVILRHFEELDDQDTDTDSEVEVVEGVNFLAILNAVLRSLTADDLSHRRELLNASYWIALRQEVYYALLKGYPPQIVEPPPEWVDISPANKLVSHANQVAKWLFGSKSESEWREYAST